MLNGELPEDQSLLEKKQYGGSEFYLLSISRRTPLSREEIVSKKYTCRAYWPF